MNDVYSTIAAPAEGVYREKGSRFVAYAYPVDGEPQARALVAQLRREFYDARHHCYAYRIGRGGACFRANDDGEPSGTGGRPILGQLLAANLTNVLVAVVRYFGGTLLGTAGLAAAYRSAAANALANAQVAVRTWQAELSVRFAYEQMNAVMRVVKDEQLRIAAQDFSGTACTLALSVREGSLPRVQELLEAAKRTTAPVAEAGAAQA